MASVSCFGNAAPKVCREDFNRSIQQFAKATTVLPDSSHQREKPSLRRMTTTRKHTAGTSSEGFHFVSGVVARANCIIQKVDTDNDQGNDAYIEFISNEVATSLFAWVQVKSGTSYRRSDCYAIPADREHIEYWNNSPVPVVGIVYDPERRLAVWINISEFLRLHPGVIENGPFTIPIPAKSVFGDDTFDEFKQQLISYNYSSDWYFGRSLDYFADIGDQQECMIGLGSLFAYHRNRKATWFYLIHAFRGIHGAAAVQVIRVLGYLPSNPYVFWHSDNIIDADIESNAKKLLAKTFGREEVLKLIGFVDEFGFAAGSLGYVVSTVVFAVENARAVLHDIAFDAGLSEESRQNALFLLIHHAQFGFVEFCIDVIDRYVALFQATEDCELFISMRETLKSTGFLGYIGT